MWWFTKEPSHSRIDLQLAIGQLVDSVSEIGADWVIASQDCFGRLCDPVTSKYHSLQEQSAWWRALYKQSHCRLIKTFIFQKLPPGTVFDMLWHWWTSREYSDDIRVDLSQLWLWDERDLYVGRHGRVAGLEASLNTVSIQRPSFSSHFAAFSWLSKNPTGWHGSDVLVGMNDIYNDWACRRAVCYGGQKRTADISY